MLGWAAASIRAAQGTYRGVGVFRQRYNNFAMQLPWSDAMAAFLRKVDYPATSNDNGFDEEGI